MSVLFTRRVSAGSPASLQPCVRVSSAALAYAVVTVIGLSGLATPARAQCFSGAGNFAAGDRPLQAAVGDFNGDAFRDLAVVNERSDDVSILLGTGAGTFGAATNFATGVLPLSVAVGDFNRDGRSDLAVTVAGPTAVAILLGTGTGAFGAPTNYAVGTDPSSVAVGDFNGDGLSDLAVANFSWESGSVSVLLGTGTGTFGAATNYVTDANSGSVAIGDFNGDGSSDLAVANYGVFGSSGSVSVLLGTGTGTFGAATNYGTGTNSNSSSVAIGDFNADGRSDLAVANYGLFEQGPGTVSVLLGTGTGTFGAITNYATGLNPGSVVVVDFNGDGWNDLAVANSGPDRTVSILMGTGTGTFAGATYFATGENASSVVSGDFNGDARADLAVTNASPDNVSILLNNICPPAVTSISPSSGSETGGSVVTITGSNFAVGATTISFGAMAASNVSCSSQTLCTATSPAGTGTVSIRLTTTSGTGADTAADDFTYTALPATSCSAFGLVTNLAAGANPSALSVGDWNSDGFPDVAATNTGSANVSIFLGSATGTFGAAANFATGSGPSSVAIGDFNGDRRSDIAVANSGSGSVWILPGTGTGTFGGAMNFGVGSSPVSLAVGDFNGDGRSDLAVANRDSSNVSILLWSSTGWFGAATHFSTGPAPSSVAVGDFNGDGRSDLAVANSGSDNVSILLGTGVGAFQAATNFGVGSSPRSVAVGDFNGDGRSDLAVANSGSDSVSILLGTGTGAFQAATNVGVGSTPSSVAIADFNGDARNDLAVANSGSTTVSILLGTGTGAFGAASNFDAGASPASVAIGDFDGNGRSDLATANGISNSVSILLNSTETGTLTLSNATFSVGEGAGTVTITVNRTVGTDCSATVNYATANGTAVAAADYTATSGTLTFASGVASQSFTIPIVDDTLFEGDEAFTVALSSAVGAALGTTTVATVTIIDNDSPPALSISNETRAEGNSGITNFSFTVTLSAVSGKTTTVNFATADGTATSRDDYASTSGTLTIVPGVASQTFMVAVIGDTVNEPDETFTVNLSAPINATITAATGTGTIQNDDGPPTLSINNVAQVEGNTGTTNFVFTVTLSSPSTQTTTVDFATVDGTATAPADFASMSGILTFAPGVMTQTITVAVVGDTTNEPDETFKINLSSPVNTTLAAAVGTATIQNDDGEPVLSINNVAQAEGDSGTTRFVFTVTLSPATAQAVTVNYTMSADTATSPGDFTSRSGTLGFAPGVTTQTIAVWVTGDTINEPDENFTVNLSAAVNATIATATGTGTIQNDDGGLEGFDPNGDNQVTVADVFYLVNFLFAGGPAPVGASGPMVSGDGNGDRFVTVADVFYVVNYLFAGGPAPVAATS